MKRFAVVTAIVLTGSISAMSLTVTGIKTYQVIPRTTQTNADLSVSGTCLATVHDIEVEVSQQGSSTPLSGFAWKSAEAVVSGTSWTGVLRALPVGGEYSVAFRGVNTAGTSVETGPTFGNVLVGDVWVASGQSNMGGTNEATAVEYVHEFNSYDGTWFRSSHNLSVAFGKTLFAETGVPTGVALVVCSGAEINFWSDGQACLTGVYGIIDGFGGRIKGFIWYQGETDAEPNANGDQRAFLYRQRLQTLIDNVRQRSGQPDLPALIVQVGSLYPAGSLLVRGAQYDLSKTDPHVATIPVYDLGGDLHLTAGRLDTAGTRLGNACLRKIFGVQTAWFGPQFRDAWFTDVQRTKIAVRYSDVSGSLASYDRDPQRWGFFVMDTAVWRQNDSTLSFDYQNPAGLLKAIDTITPLAADRICIQLEAPVPMPVTIGFSRASAPAVAGLDFVTDATGIPMASIFGYPVLTSEPQTVLDRNAAPGSARVSIGREPARLTVLGAGARTYPRATQLLTVNGRTLLSPRTGTAPAFAPGVFCVEGTEP